MKKKKLVVIGVLFLMLSIIVFIFECLGGTFEPIVTRNGYGDGKKTEIYEVTVEDQTRNIELEVWEQAYTKEEIQKVFRKVERKLDQVILGENKTFDHVDKDLQLVTSLDEYPVEIQWQVSEYRIVGTKGEILTEELDEKGTLVELRGTITCQGEEMIYVRNARIYPPTRTGIEKVFYRIQKEAKERETATREKSSFQLPKTVGNVKVIWGKKESAKWPYVLLVGGFLIIFLLYREREERKKKEKNRKQIFLREYPNVVSKFTMLLGTGATVKCAWEKIVQNYEEQKEKSEKHPVYEEMKVTMHEMKSGIPEVEAYERFGKRYGIDVYLKFGTLLSQNLRKGSKGMSEILRMEAIQAFEKRKSEARQLGEEAGAKLLIPMMGMLVVVLVMIMAPAFLTMQM